jgi:DNA repair protein RadC
MKAVLARNAVSVIAFHNHPSGLAEPSQADEHTTLRLKNTLALIDVQLIDHLIIGESVFSFAEQGLL